jgi:surface antigen
MAEEQAKKRVRKPKEVSAGPKTAPARRTTAPEVASASKTHAARVHKPVKMPTSGTRTTSSAVSAADRQRMIAECAYYLAESRSFAGGDCEADWYAAETWIDTQLSA